MSAHGLLEERLTECGSASLQAIVEAAVRVVAPERYRVPPESLSGLLWFGSALAGPGAAAYVNARWGDPVHRWARALDWLHEVTATEACEQVLAASAAVTRLASVGVEGADGTLARLKLYFRLDGQLRLAALGISAEQLAALGEFIGIMFDAGSIPATGLLVCLGVDTLGRFVDVKLDICGHCLALQPRAAAARLRRLSDSFGLALDPLDAMRIGHLTNLAFVGCGVTWSGETRVKTYLKGHGRNEH
jgi:hypothetical protein